MIWAYSQAGGPRQPRRPLFQFLYPEEAHVLGWFHRFGELLTLV